MDFKEVDHALEELEGRIERLKALYEQYFMGIEKLEPLVPRKDVDRRIQILRREQVRNTAQRFKFQTLVQRYNSFQQYWARVAREIENGTYHRDVARAAARFGAKDALTIFGKKQAEKYQRLVTNQEARRAKRKTTHVIDEEMLADDELLFVDDEAAENAADDFDDESRPTPVIPSVRAPLAPPMPAIPPLPPPPRASSPGIPAVPPPLPPVMRASGQMPAPVVSMKADETEEIDLQDDEIFDVVQDKPAARARKNAAIRPETMFPIMMRRPSEQVARVSEPPPPEAGQRSPSIPPDPEAGKKRVAALAAQVKQRTSSTIVAQVNQPLDLELDLGQGARGAGASATKSAALDLDFDGDSKPKEKRSAKAEQKLELDLDPGAQPRQTQLPKVETPAPASTRAPEVKRSEDEGLAGRTPRIEARPKLDTLPEIRELPVDSSRTPPSVRAEQARVDQAQADKARLAVAARERAANAREASAREASGSAASLSESRIRQIYGEYVDAKRRVRESTAGVTYDALAKQLRQQAEKLEATNPGRKVDYSVVMKNGKPTLKPILR
jgi:hypothetical protein